MKGSSCESWRTCEECPEKDTCIPWSDNDDEE